MTEQAGWIGVDLDGTLAHYNGWVDETHIGEPIQGMADRVRGWLADGIDVRIFTARADGGNVAVAMGNAAGERLVMRRTALRESVRAFADKRK